MITARHAPPRETRPIISQRSHRDAAAAPGCPDLGAIWNTAPTPRRWPGSASSAAPSGSRVIAEWRDCSLRRRGRPRGGDQPAHHCHGDHHLRGLVSTTPAPGGDVARALRTVMCSRESIHPADVRTTHQNVQVVRDGRSSEVKPSHRALGQGGRRAGIVEGRGRQPGPLHPGAAGDCPSTGTAFGAGERLLREDTADQLHRWAVAVAPQTMSPEQTPVITEYGGDDLPQPAGGPLGGVLRPAGHRLGVRADAVRRVDA